jgi:hypothetical protein
MVIFTSCLAGFEVLDYIGFLQLTILFEIIGELGIRQILRQTSNEDFSLSLFFVFRLRLLLIKRLFTINLSLRISLTLAPLMKCSFSNTFSTPFTFSKDTKPKPPGRFELESNTTVLSITLPNCLKYLMMSSKPSKKYYLCLYLPAILPKRP